MDSKNLYNIGKILGIKIDKNEKDTDKMIEFFKTLDKYNEYLEILSFLKLSGRNNLTHFMFKVKKVITDEISNKDYYKNIDTNEFKKEINQIKNSLKYNPMKDCYSDVNDSKKFISLDIKSANFTSLKLISNGQIILEKWSDYFKYVVPNDIRSDRMSNKNNMVSGVITVIPDCIYESKFMRQFILGDLLKLKFVWELINLKMMKSICDLNIQNSIYMNSDEIIIQVNNYEEADKLISIIPFDSKVYNVKKFTINSLPNNKKNYMIKTIINNNEITKKLLNINPNDYFDLYKKFIINSY